MRPNPLAGLVLGSQPSSSRTQGLSKALCGTSRLNHAAVKNGKQHNYLI